MGAPKTYDQVHAGLFWAFGKASSHLCLCGNPATHWAYLHNAGKEELRDENGSPYSENFEHYAPKCLSCHRKFDLENNPDQVSAFREVGRRSPKDQEKHRAASLAGAAAVRARSLVDVGFQAVLLERGKKLGSIRRRCAECPAESNAGGIGLHQQASGHTGWTVSNQAISPLVR